MKLPKGITYNKARNRFKVVYKGLFVGYHTTLADAQESLDLISVKYLHQHKKMMQNLENYAKMIRGDKE